MKYTQKDATPSNAKPMPSAGMYRKRVRNTTTAKIVESRLELRAPCPSCGIYHIVKLHDDGVCTILCRCTVSRYSPDGLNDVYIVDPATVKASIARRVRTVEVPQDY